MYRHPHHSLYALTLPVLLGYIPLGLTFGFLMVSQGIAWYIPILFSVFVYAGAAQFLAVGLIVNRVPLADVALLTFLLNLRHIFYGLSLFDFLPHGLLKRVYFIFGITDETYSLMTSTPEVNKDNALSVVAINHLYWVVGTIIGALLASSLPPIKGVEFSLSALFVILLVEQIRMNPSMKLLAMGILACVLATLIAPSYFLVLSSAIALALLIGDYVLQAGRSTNGGAA
ncbi:Inner membrane protein YgaZ [Ephemeroptericola cinctiostellae]|uniref:Inner membrane protein YgaZ n=1 Tax=Ephemeroptericola cinctiostellae TaxID=2268024 RepID=A0A345D819_9BURK|nr:AzlC family ABC transporter permease [Ephemeroptericola cinctiostellae]AXF84507.1 Inner membrane protein YgaZ [Ephemeroptericola cinctiostellae]